MSPAARYHPLWDCLQPDHVTVIIFFGSDIWHLPSGLINFYLTSHLSCPFVSIINSSSRQHDGSCWRIQHVMLLSDTPEKFQDSFVSLQESWPRICIQHRCCNTVHTVKGQEEQSGKSSTIKLWVSDSMRFLQLQQVPCIDGTLTSEHCFKPSSARSVWSLVLKEVV